MKLQPKKTAVPVNWVKSLLLVGGLGILTWIAFILAPSDQISGFVISLSFFAIWTIVIGFSILHGQWVPLLIGSIYLLGASAIRLYAENALKSERGIPTILNNILTYSGRALNGFAYLSEVLPVIITTLLALLTLIALVIVMDRNKPKIIEDSDPIDW